SFPTRRSSDLDHLDLARDVHRMAPAAAGLQHAEILSGEHELEAVVVEARADELRVLIVLDEGIAMAREALLEPRHGHRGQTRGRFRPDRGLVRCSHFPPRALDVGPGRCVLARIADHPTPSTGEQARARAPGSPVTPPTRLQCGLWSTARRTPPPPPRTRR